MSNYLPPKKIDGGYWIRKAHLPEP